MPQDRQDAYRNYFAALHDFSQSRFGVVADISDLHIYIVDAACGGIVSGGSTLGTGIDHLTFGDECMDDRGLFEGYNSAHIAEAYFHLLVDWSPFSAMPDWTTGWILNGSMLYFSRLWVDHHQAVPYDAYRNGAISIVSSTRHEIPPLSQDPDVAGSFSLAFLAIDYLAEQTSATKPIDYFAAARRSTPSRFAQDFQSVFGISPDEFYDYFAAHRAAGFPQPGASFGPTPTPTDTPTSTPEPESPTPTYTPTHTPTITPTPESPTPTYTPVSGGQIDNRVSELERQTGMLQQLIQNLQALIQALTARMDAIDGGSLQPTHTPTPTTTPSPPPTSVPGTDPTPVTTPVTDNACIEQIELAALIAGTTIAGSWTPDCLTANPEPTNLTIEFFAKFYTFTLDGREREELEIRITSDETPYIFLMAGEGTDGEVIAQFAVEPGEQTQLALGPGSYTMEVSTDGSGVTGDFTLELNLRR